MTALVERPVTTFPAGRARFAPAPAEERGLARDGVRLLVASPAGVVHARFSDLRERLSAGDLVVVNDSATLAAATDASSPVLGPVVLHAAEQLQASTQPDGASWVVELRTAPDAGRAVLDAAAGEVLRVGSVSITLLGPHADAGSSPTGHGTRLWRAAVRGDLRGQLDRAGRPIAYGYLDRRYPLSAYQSVFGVRPGSAEMASAGRPFTSSLVTELVSHGVGVAPITLHTGVSSQEAGEAPQPERFAVSAATAGAVNAVRAGGGRVVAVGTTVTRALESAVADGGRVVARSGTTERVVTTADPPRVVTALITGWHDPQASHLLLLEAVAGPDLVQRAYDEALARQYLWHEFGDSALFLPAAAG